VEKRSRETNAYGVSCHQDSFTRDCL